MRDSARAITAFRQGVSLNPALVASWNALESLYRLIGDSSNSAAAERVANLRKLPSEIVQAGNLSADGDLAAAERLLRAYIKE